MGLEMEKKNNHTVRDAFIIAGIIIALFALCKQCMKSSEESSSRSVPQMTAGQTSAIEDMIKSGTIRFQGELRVYVSPIFWAVCDAATKEKLAYGCAKYLASKRGDNNLIIDVYDSQSGKKIAKYDAFGFKVF